MNFNNIHIWLLWAGLGLFLFGMYMLEDSLKALAGRSFKQFIQKYTNKPIKAVLVGIGSTAIFQSSSMVSLIVMSFAGAGIIELRSGIGLIMGSHLGTTATGWLIALLGFNFDFKVIVYPLLAIGGTVLVFLKSVKLQHFAKLFLSFGFLFMGLSFMKDGFAEFVKNVDLNSFKHQNILVYFLIGAILTAVIQSSSASMVIFLSALNSGMIDVESGYGLVIGANLGTTVTALIGAIGGNTIRKKVALSHFLIHLVTVGVGFAFIGLYHHFIISALNIQNPLFQLVGFHTFLNFIGIILLFPFIGFFEKVLNKMIQEKNPNYSLFISKIKPLESISSLQALKNETTNFIQKAILLNKRYLGLDKKGLFVDINSEYLKQKNLEDEIVAFYLKVQQLQLNEKESNALSKLIDSVRNASLASKDIKDIAHNLDSVLDSSDQNLQILNNEISEYQNQFYLEFSELLQSKNDVKNVELERLISMNKDFRQKINDSVYLLANEGENKDIDVSSLLNMVREIVNSNAYLIQSLNFLLK